ncbi:MAG TPA: hypothetical protein VIX86_06215 [Streptosporangiaceae bacterium]
MIIVVGLVSAAVAAISAVLTAILVAVLGLAALGAIALAVIIWRTRVVTRRPSSAFALAGRARPALTTRQPMAVPARPVRPPLAIGQRAPVPAPLAVPQPEEIRVH